MGITFFGITNDIGEAVERAFELVERGEEVKAEEMIERLEKIAPKEWLKNEDFAEDRFRIEECLDEIKEGISLCDCSETMEAVHLATWTLVALWDEISKSELSAKDKHILIEDLQNIDGLLKQLLPEFNMKCVCKSSIIL